MKTQEGKKADSLKKEIEILSKRNTELFKLRELKLERIRNKLGSSYPAWATKHPELSSTAGIILSSLKVQNGHKETL